MDGDDKYMFCAVRENDLFMVNSGWRELDWMIYTVLTKLMHRPVLFIELISDTGRKKAKCMDVFVNKLLVKLTACNKFKFDRLSLTDDFCQFPYESRVVWQGCLEVLITAGKQTRHG